MPVINDILRLGKTSDTKSYTGSYDAAPAQAAAVRRSFASSCSPNDREALLSDTQQFPLFATLWATEIVILANPRVILDPTSNTLKIVASASDTIGAPCAVVIPPETWRGFVTTLVPAGVAREFTLRTADEAPDEIEGSPEAQVPDHDGAMINAPPSLARLHFGEVPDADSAPKFAAVPLLFPLPKGMASPHRLSLDDDAMDLQDPGFAFWRQGLHWLVTNNNSQSATEAGPMFATADIASRATNFPDLLILQQIPAAPVEIVPPVGSPVGDLYRPLLEDFDREAFIRLGHREDMPLQPGGPAPAPAGLPPTITLTTPKTLKEKEFASAAAEVNAKYRLLFARTEPNPDPTGPALVIPAQLGMLSELNEHSNLATATKKLQDRVRSARQAAHQSDHYLDSMVTFNADMITEGFVKVLRTYSIMSVPVNQEPKYLSTHLSLFAFLSPDVASVQFQNMLSATNELLQADIAADLASEKSPAAQKKTELYVGGDLSSIQSARIAYANFRFLFRTCGLIHKDDYSRSALDVCFRAYESIHASSDGRSFAERFGRNVVLAINVVVDYQDILGNFAKIGETPAYVEAVIQDAPISPEAFTKARNIMQRAREDITLAITRGKPDTYRVWPAIAGILPQVTVPTDLTPGLAPDDSSSKGRTLPRSDPANKRAKSGDASPPDAATLEARKSKGWLVYTGTGPLICPIRYKARGQSSPEKLCRDFITIGLACRYGRNCKFHHSHSL